MSLINSLLVYDGDLLITPDLSRNATLAYSLALENKP